MAQQAARIVSDDDVLGGEPRIEERPITARRIAELVEEGDADAETVADRYDLDVADVYRALAYYHDHPEEMAAVRRRRERLESDARADGVPTLDEPEALRAGADEPSVAALARRQERVLLTNDADFLDKRNTPNRPSCTIQTTGCHRTKSPEGDVPDRNDPSRLIRRDGGRNQSEFISLRGVHK